MSADVSQLVVLIERILAGSVVSYEEVINADWRADGELDRFANEAHFDLKFWVDDEDIRAKDHEYLLKSDPS